MTFGDIVVLAVLGMIVGTILGSMARKKKAGKSSCCGGCTSCAGCAGCSKLGIKE